MSTYCNLGLLLIFIFSVANLHKILIRVKDFLKEFPVFNVFKSFIA